MAAEYEVNIKLNTKSVEQQLKNIDTRTKRTGRMATENINALVKAQDKRARLMNKINELEAKGLNVARLRKQMGQATNELAKRRFGSLQQELRVLERNVRLEESKLRIMRSQAIAARDRAKFLAGANVSRGQFGPAAPAAQGPRQMMASPIGGATDIKGSPAFLARQRRNKRLEQVGLGAGFPLLFGGGPGSVLGGAAGGLAGSFGAQIALSALGQQIDQMVASVINAGKAFTSVGGAADFMAEKSLFSSDSMQFRIEKLIEEGNATEAAALMTQEMAKQVGGSGLKALTDLGTEASKMGKLFGTLLIRIQAFMANALTPLLKLINSAIGNINARSQLDQMLREAESPEQRAQILQRSDELRGVRRSRRTGKVIGKKAVTSGVITQLQKDFPAVIPEGAEIKPTQLELLRAADAGAGKQDTEAKKAARRLKASQERIRLLGIEATKIKDITQLKDRIAQAELDGDKQLVVRIGLEQEIAEINAKKDVAMERLVGRDLPLEQQLREQIAITSAADAREAEAKAEAVRDLAVIQRNEDQRRMDAMKKHIEEQYKLNTAVQQQLALADGISNIMGEGMTQAFDALIDGADNWGNALRDIAANVLRNIAKQLIQIYIIEQSIGFMKALMTPFDPSTGLGEGGGQVGRFGTLGPNYGIAQFANGGNPPVGRPSLVGERGPELFVPRSAGTIIPNHAMGGGANVTVNVDASGSNVQGDQPNAKALGSAIGAAVQAELVKQKRPGGLLS